MVMRELKAYLQQRGRVPLQDMANHFRKDPRLVMDMLAHWERKGQVRKIVAVADCQKSGCSGCGSHPQEIYEWVN